MQFKVGRYRITFLVEDMSPMAQIKRKAMENLAKPRTEYEMPATDPIAIKIAYMKAAREVLNLGLKEAKDFVELNFPTA